MAHVYDVARYVLSKQSSMSAMKLQKLVYYSQAWHLVFDGKPLFDSEIEAWANGPVVRDLYYKHRGLFTVDKDTFPASDVLLDSERSTIDAVVETYGSYSAGELSNFTHSERPWLQAREGMPAGARSSAVIDVATMWEFYQQVYDQSAK